MDSERWVPIPVNEGYEVSTYGRVMSKAKTWNSARKYARTQSTPDTLMTLRNNGKGTCQVKIRGKQQNVARLVAMSFIPNPEHKPFVDHINGDIMDNRVENLRWATNEENQINRSLMETNTSGASGVNRVGNRWRARVYIGGERVSLGSFETLKEAEDVITKARVAYYGEFVRPQAGSVPPSALR